MAQGDPCTLCELACGRQQVLRAFEGRDLAFCCMGCANVYAILIESGAVAAGEKLRETAIFRRSLEMGLISNPEPDAKPPAAALDPNLPTAEALYQVGGMWCTACGWLIEHALERLPGVVSAEVFFASDLARVRYCPQYLPPERIPARIAELGYRAAEYGGEDARAATGTRDLLLRLGVAAFLWANIMAFSTILYVGYFEQIAKSVSRVLPWVLFVLATPLVFYCAWPILRPAFLGLRQLQLRMETLLALGILAAYLLSAVQTVRGRTHVYFDTAAAIVTLVLAGKLIEREAKDRAARSIAGLYRQMPRKARVAAAGGERFVAIGALEPGTVFLVKAGERIPADGVLIEGETETDESLLTGESAPVAKRVGDTVVSGSLNAGGAIRVRALRTSQESALGQILRLVEHALSTRAPIERTVDRISRIFVPIVIALAAAAFAVLLFRHAGMGAALLRATAILVIACPCALGLATPLAITAAVGSASAQGVLIADSRALEAARGIDAVVLDKTGTVTDGDFRLLDSALAPAAETGNLESEWLPLLAGMESFSEHLLGRAVMRYAQERRVEPSEVSRIEILKGQGISALSGGRRAFLGNRVLAAAEGAALEEAAERQALEWERQGRTVAFFGIDGKLGGLVCFGDRVKAGAAEMAARLRARSMAVKMVSGDARLTTEAVAGQIGIDDFAAEATPEAKARIISEMQSSGLRVAMIGDGVNDAPALAQAELGIALGTGAEIAMGAAQIVLAGGALSKIEDVFWLGARATSVVRQNLFWAFFYNLAGISLALAGVLTPIYAAAAMLLSSVSVVANSMRLSRPIGRRT